MKFKKIDLQIILSLPNPFKESLILGTCFISINFSLHEKKARYPEGYYSQNRKGKVREGLFVSTKLAACLDHEHKFIPAEEKENVQRQVWDITPDKTRQQSQASRALRYFIPKSSLLARESTNMAISIS